MGADDLVDGGLEIGEGASIDGVCECVDIVEEIVEGAWGILHMLGHITGSECGSAFGLDDVASAMDSELREFFAAVVFSSGQFDLEVRS